MPQSFDNYYADYEETKSKRTGLFVGLGLVIVVAFALVLIVRATKPKLIPAPTAFVKFQAPDQSFVVDQPRGWTSTTSGSEGVETSVDFTAGNAKVSVGSDLAGSLYGDIAQAQNNQLANMSSLAGVSTTAQVPPIDKIHMMGRQEVAGSYSNYEEQPMETITAKIGVGRISEFTGQGGTFVGPVHGYRATFLDSQRSVTVLAVCPRRNWTILAPTFVHEIQSVGPGSQ
jgi:hypothetical protein